MRALKRSVLCLLLALSLALSGAVPAVAATNKIEKILKGMSLNEKVGQMFLADSPAADAQKLAKAYQPGGYVLFARDFENKTPPLVKKAVAGYQGVSKVPMLIAVDEEGGSVTRISRFKAFRSSAFQSPQASNLRRFLFRKSSSVLHNRL